MKYCIISGSTRENSQSAKVAHFVQKQIKRLNPDDEAYVLDLSSTKIPEWNEDFWVKGEEWDSNWRDTSAILKSSDAIIIIAPEWNGMVPPSLINIFHLCSNNELSHKPALIIAISSNANGGSYPIAALRMNSYKNTKICYIPDHVIIKNVTEVLNAEDSSHDTYIRERLQHSLKVLDIYANALKQIRAEQILYLDSYKYGM